MSAGDTVQLVPNGGWDERVLVVECSGLVRTFIVVSERYVVLVDTLLNPAAATALLEIARPHLQGRQLLVINTHGDWDHAWGNQVFGGDEPVFPAPIIASRRCAERLRSTEAQAELDLMRLREAERFGGVRLTPPMVLFDHQLIIDGGDLTIELFPTPGHQPDHIALAIPEISMLLAGDAAEFPFPFVHNADGVPLLRASLAAMADRGFAHALYCHAPIESGPALLRANMAYFDEVERRCRAALQRSPLSELGADAIETFTGYPFEEAVAGAGISDEGVATFYRNSHRAALQSMLGWLTSQAK